ncbi:CGNR zinc finger domain-containing protein [Halomonas maura]|uniref:CGNR zinc finger domain-containing protein n=1 Tax=Halomonas maura TaxID=117606 RepID=UPI0025B2ED27|nr:ABATE domain-containing protein [Halomonas maura]MDN3557511.1 CGNR zinc finger domain-containing protein [Halomonas maura]
MDRHPWTDHDFIAGDPCLDFLNTVGDSGKTRTQERLVDARALDDWALARGLISSHGAPASTARELAAALALRERLHALFASIARGEADALAWEAVRGDLAAALAVSRLAAPDTLALAAPRLPERLALAALSLLHDGRLSRLKECARCSWLFLDQSKARRRRWCRTEVCGNRARVERHYRRRHGGAAT